MGTLVFMPWVTLARSCVVGDFELKPVLLDESARRRGDEQDWWLPTTDAARVLQAYRTPPDIPLASATVVRPLERDFEAELTEPEIDRLFLLGEAIAFAGLSQRRFFEYSGYSNRDSFLLIGQRFVPGKGGASIVQRTRYGRRIVGVPEDLWVVRQEPHIETLSRLELDSEFARVVFAEMDAREEFEQAVRSYNEANTDRSSLSEAQELVSIVSAFQQFLGVRGGSTRETAIKFAEAMRPFTATCPASPEKAKVAEKVLNGKVLREVWMEDLAVLRGSVGHGHKVTAYPSAWTAKEHLLLAAHVFPLLVKASLSAAGKRSLHEDEADELRIFDCLLASENVLEGNAKSPGVPTAHNWSRIRREALDDLYRERTRAALEALLEE